MYEEQKGFEAKKASEAVMTSDAAILGVAVCQFIVGLEKHGNAPDTGYSNENVYNSRKHGFCSSCNPGNRIKGEKTNQAPVKGADYNEYKGDFVNYGHHC